MVATNYVAHAIDDLREFLRSPKIDPSTREGVEWVINGLQVGQKFRLPDKGSLLYGSVENRIEWGRTFVRMPYEYTVLEYFRPAVPADSGSKLYGADGKQVDADEAGSTSGGDDFSVRMVVLCHQPVDSDLITVFEVFSAEGGKFVPSPDWVEYDPVGQVCAPRVLSPKHSGLLANTIRAYAKAITILSEFKAALACKNVEVEDGEAPSPALNKARQSRGKQPLFTYKELVLKARASASNAGGGLSDRAPPRVHLRRGHIRRLADDRHVWVNAAVVGDKSRGMVVKDYRLTA